MRDYMGLVGGLGLGFWVLDFSLLSNSIRREVDWVFPLVGFFPCLEPISCVHFFCDLHVYVFGSCLMKRT